MRRQIIAAVCSTVVCSSAGAEENYNYLGKRGYAVWECAAFAAIAESRPDKYKKLFLEGYEILREFVVAAREGKLTEDNTNEVPIGVHLYLTGGPTADFSLGYMWAQFIDEAYDETWPEEMDAPFDQRKESQQSKALNRFQEKNCALLAE